MKSLICLILGGLAIAMGPNVRANPARRVTLQIWITQGDCQKCILGFKQNLRCARKRLQDSVQVDIVAAVRCERKVELELFKQQYAWQDSVMMGTEDYLSDKHLPTNVRIVAIEGDKPIASITEEHFFEADCEALLELIRSSPAKE